MNNGIERVWHTQLSIFVRGCDMVCYGRFTLLVAGHSVPIHPISTREVPEVLEELF